MCVAMSALSGGTGRTPASLWGTMREERDGTMTLHSPSKDNPVAERLRPLVYLYAAANLAVAALLLSTVSAVPAPEGASQVAALR